MVELKKKSILSLQQTYSPKFVSIPLGTEDAPTRSIAPASSTLEAINLRRQSNQKRKRSKAQVCSNVPTIYFEIIRGFRFSILFPPTF